MWAHFRCGRTGQLRLINMNLVTNIVNKENQITLYYNIKTLSYTYKTVDEAICRYKEIANAIRDNKETIFFDEKELK
jgi:hypothetical protein